MIVNINVLEEGWVLVVSLHYIKEVEIYQVNKIWKIVTTVSLKRGMVNRLSIPYKVINYIEAKVDY